MSKGLVHLYHGEGKGKTTAAMGLAVRALGQGKRVVVLQFLKDGTSGELQPLEKLGAQVFSGPSGTRLAFRMTEEEKAEAAGWSTKMLQHAFEIPCDMLILDELCAARRYNMVSEEEAKRAVLDRPAACEVIITGRNPEKWMIDAADYITEMKCVRHPFEKGIAARRGIEF